MTKEARIKSILREIEYGFIGYDNLHGDNDQGLEIIADALKKYLPVNPEEYFDGYADGYPVIEYSCPNCGRDLYDDSEHHCICGQTIKWPD